MRFLIFNLAVAAALFHLLARGDGDLENRIGALSDDVVRWSGALLEGARSGLALHQTPVPVLRRSPAEAPPAGPAAAVPRPANSPKGGPLAGATADGADAGLAEMAPPLPPQRPAAPESAAAGAPPAPAAATAGYLLPVTDPAVLRRRAEVLQAPAAQPPPAAPAAGAAPPTAFMTPAQRRRELRALSEEMELLFANMAAR